MSELVAPAKLKLIETSALLVYRQGWNATGINQILSESGVPKGSFYYYFHSKDDLGAAIVRYNAQKLHESYSRTLLNCALSGRVAIEKFFEEQLALHRKCEWRYGCPLGSFSNEVAATTENIALACREAFAAGTEAFAAALERGKTDRSLELAEDTGIVAIAVMSAWQGSLLSMKTLRSAEPLKATLNWICRSIIPSGLLASRV